jgi:hypothetical protein
MVGPFVPDETCCAHGLTKSLQRCMRVDLSAFEGGGCGVASDRSDWGAYSTGKWLPWVRLMRERFAELDVLGRNVNEGGRWRFVRCRDDQYCKFE